jgi:hypothetical protein
VRRIVGVFVAAMIMALLGVGVALADPIKSKNAQVFDISCSNGQTYEIVVAGASPGLIVDSTDVIVPTEATLEILDPETGEVISSETFPIGQGHKKGLQGDLITCETEPQPGVDPETGEPNLFVIRVEAFLTPRGK